VLTAAIGRAYHENSVNLQELLYFSALAEHRHFGRAAKACHVSQPTLSGQIRKLEEHLGVTLFERNNKWVALTPVGERILEHSRKALEEVSLMQATAKSSHDQLVGPLKLGVIPTLAPYLVPLILGPLRERHPDMPIELWEDLTVPLLDLLRSRRLEAALIATEVPAQHFTSEPLFVEPFLAALPQNHRLAGKESVRQGDLAGDLLVLADGHCLAAQALAACRPPQVRGAAVASSQRAFQAGSLDTLVNLVAAGYGTTLIPALAANSLRSRNLVLRPLKTQASRTVRLASRPSFPRPLALAAVKRIILEATAPLQPA
jgi:LysR family hydrogen peroxide-inducible transcriptional activator